MTALDDENNTATSFVGRVLIDDLTETLHPDSSGYFVRFAILEKRNYRLGCVLFLP